jgi:FMN-dependent NADH-azoreductase
VRDFLAFLGLNEVEFIYAEGLAVSDTARHQGIARAHAQIDRLVRPEMAVA